jgi:hypothetical protein
VGFCARVPVMIKPQVTTNKISLFIASGFINPIYQIPA